MNRKLEENKHFFNRWAFSYDSPWFQFWMKKFHASILRELQGKEKVAVLDLSCGTGQLLQSLCHQNIQLTGVDYSPEMIKIARKRLPPLIKLYQADVHALPFRGNTFDYVVSTEAFHHYYNQRKAIAQMKRVVKKGGKVIIVDVNFFLRPIHWLFQKIEPGCVRINSRKEMHELFTQAGLTSITQQRTFLFAVVTMGIKK